MFALGWRDILRPIRDGLRDRFPHPKPDRDIEKGRQQQRADAFRRFTYFEDFEQLLDWRAQNMDPIQRANTPLLPRVVRPLEERGEEARANVLLCHDYCGNYHPYESVQGLESMPKAVLVNTCSSLEHSSTSRISESACRPRLGSTLCIATGSKYLVPPWSN